MAVYVVTGGAGFIGSNVVVRLVAEGEEVRVVDDFSTGRRESLSGPAAVGARRAVPLRHPGLTFASFATKRSIKLSLQKYS
ncbi:MAG: NAD-dependent epimerase/dehydratase family protein [Candidatus Brocadiae bacterium]|nr:NAD-dependent epimerase/dehydratase family protein [Candidatus Brocadiia bacterium]